MAARLHRNHYRSFVHYFILFAKFQLKIFNIFGFQQWLSTHAEVVMIDLVHVSV